MLVSDMYLTLITPLRPAPRSFSGLRPATIVSEMFRLSPLRVRVLNTCRLRYRYQYVERIPARLRPQDTAGTLVHNLLCEFFAQGPPGGRTPARLLALFQQRQ